MDSRSTQVFGVVVLAIGLIVGVTGSYFDNLAGDGTWTSVTQVFLWVVGGLAACAGLALLAGRRPRPVPDGSSEARAAQRHEQGRRRLSTSA